MNPYSAYSSQMQQQQQQQQQGHFPTASSAGFSSTQQQPSYDVLLQRIKQLDEENTRLRNDKIEANEEIFSLKAVMATVEAEAKYNSELELKKLESELTFKNKEIASLSREHQQTMKDLSAMREQYKTLKADTDVSKVKAQHQSDKAPLLQQTTNARIGKDSVRSNIDTPVDKESSSDTVIKMRSDAFEDISHTLASIFAQQYQALLLALLRSRNYHTTTKEIEGVEVQIESELVTQLGAALPMPNHYQSLDKMIDSFSTMLRILNKIRIKVYKILFKMFQKYDVSSKYTSMSCDLTMGLEKVMNCCDLMIKTILLTPQCRTLMEMIPALYETGEYGTMHSFARGLTNKFDKEALRVKQLQRNSDDGVQKDQRPQSIDVIHRNEMLSHRQYIIFNALTVSDDSTDELSKAIIESSAPSVHSVKGLLFRKNASHWKQVVLKFLSALQDIVAVSCSFISGVNDVSFIENNNQILSYFIRVEQQILEELLHVCSLMSCKGGACKVELELSEGFNEIDIDDAPSTAFSHVFLPVISDNLIKSTSLTDDSSKNAKKPTCWRMVSSAVTLKSSNKSIFLLFKSIFLNECLFWNFALNSSTVKINERDLRSHRTASAEDLKEFHANSSTATTNAHNTPPSMCCFFREVFNCLVNACPPNVDVSLEMMNCTEDYLSRLLYQLQIVDFILQLMRFHGKILVAIILGIDPVSVQRSIKSVVEKSHGNSDKSTYGGRNPRKEDTVGGRSVRRRLDHVSPSSARRQVGQERSREDFNTPMDVENFDQHSSEANVVPLSSSGGRNRGLVNSVSRITPVRSRNVADNCAWWLSTYNQYHSTQERLVLNTDEIDRRSINDMAQLWMHIIRVLDIHPSSNMSDNTKKSSSELLMDKILEVRIALVRKLTATLDIIVGYLKPEDCESVLRDTSHLFHEFINRWSSGSWHPQLNLSEVLMSNLSFGSTDLTTP